MVHLLLAAKALIGYIRQRLALQTSADARQNE
jgi:hypothetical protein